MSDDNPNKKESLQKDEKAEKKQDLSENDLAKVSGGLSLGPETCPVCGGPPDHVHENR